MTKTIISKITFEPLIYPRRISEDSQEPFYIHVRRYARAMKTGALLKKYR